jgi:hypothetical protein
MQAISYPRYKWNPVHSRHKAKEGYRIAQNAKLCQDFRSVGI